MIKTLNAILASITPPDPLLFTAAREQLDKMAIPRGSLGRLEECAQRMVAITGTLNPPLKKKRVVVFAADHGVVEEGVSAFAQDVTAQMVYNFIGAGAAINVLATHVGAEVLVVDIGVAGEIMSHPGLLLKKVAPGTRNMAQGPAMTRQEALQGLLVGIEIAGEMKQQQIDIIATGDMGIGNTTASSAIAAVITRRKVEEVTGRGTGISDEMLRHKINVIKKSISLNQPDARDPLDVLTKVGGYEIAGIAGLLIGSSFHKIPVVINGVISTAAALIAVSLHPAINQYLFAGHKSQEQGHAVMLEWLEQKPLLDLSMRLGEGTGAALAMSIIEAGVKVLTHVLTFEDAKVKRPVHPCEG